MKDFVCNVIRPKLENMPLMWSDNKLVVDMGVYRYPQNCLGGHSITSVGQLVDGYEPREGMPSKESHLR